MGKSWEGRNKRRFDLIYKKHNEGLTDSEELELEQLQQEASDRMPRMQLHHNLVRLIRKCSKRGQK